MPTSNTSVEMTRQPKRSIEFPQFRFVYVYTIATDAPVTAPWLIAASGDRSNGTLPTSKTSTAITRVDRNSANIQIYAYEIKQSVSKNFFLLLRTTPLLTTLHIVYFPAITRVRLLLSHSKNNFSTTPTPTEKPRYTYCRVFLVDSIYSTTIDIITNNILFSIFKQRAYVYIWPAG